MQDLIEDLSKFVLIGNDQMQTLKAENYLIQRQKAQGTMADLKDKNVTSSG